MGSLRGEAHAFLVEWRWACACRRLPRAESAATLVIPVGVGVQWDLDSRTRLFVQASYDILFRHLSVQSIPLVAGFEIRF